MSRLLLNLYDELEVKFTSNGIAIITDVFNVQEVNKKNDAHYLEFEFKKTSNFYNQIKEGRFIKYDNNIFIIRLVEEFANGLKHTVYVYAEHILFELIDTGDNSNTFQEETPAAILDGLLFSTRFKGESNLTNYTVDLSTKNESKLNAIDKLCANANAIRICEGMPDAFDDKFIIKLISNDGEPVATLVHNRKNLKSIKRIIDGKNVITRVYPFGAEDLTIETAQNSNGLQYIDADNVNDYRIPREARIVFNDINDADTLYEAGLAYLERNNKIKYSYEVDVDELDKTVKIGDKITVIDEELGDAGIRIEVLVSEIRKIQEADTNRIIATLEEPIKTMEQLLADMLIVTETDTGVRRGNVWTEFVNVPFSNSTITIDFSVNYKTKPVINCHVIGPEALTPIINYIEQTDNNGVNIYTGITIDVPTGAGQDITMLAFGRI